MANMPSPLRNQTMGKKIMKQTISLIMWLLYINAAVLKHLNATWIISPHRKLVDWIFNMIFEPQNSLPVIGRFSSQDIQAFAKGKEFGPIQRMLITLLSSSTWSSREPQTAVMIISNYYENECLEVSHALKSGQLPDLRSFAIQSKNSNVRIGSGFDEASWIQELGNFPVRSLQHLPESLKPKFYTRDILNERIFVNLGPSKPELSDNILKILSAEKPSMYQSFNFKFNDSKFPVVIRFKKRADNQGRNHGWVWLSHTINQTLMAKKDLLNKLKRFMSHLNICHSALLRHMKDTKSEIRFELQPYFINWIHQVLFDVNQNKLPLLGEFVLEDGKSMDSFSPEDFNEIQRLLIRLITSHNSHWRTFQVALSVFGYWLKNMAGLLYNQLFKNDEEYWDILTKIIDSVSYPYNKTS
ncbi:hypothetical protein VP01_2910g6 [Puccinia sorghi]|uniref:Uncharacterized protein n=1 Tax=Puccinia sorghi TaxID=27349 RepID=A0A0L6V1F5_9BASI|nr:hypothetical protein VP01_2910g6 [Puccinia sorghi]